MVTKNGDFESLKNCQKSDFRVLMKIRFRLKIAQKCARVCDLWKNRSKLSIFIAKSAILPKIFSLTENSKISKKFLWKIYDFPLAFRSSKEIFAEGENAKSLILPKFATVS